MSAIARILDANANRAREALRVMEDAARFALNDASLSATLKSIRHDLRAALDRLPASWMEASRDTPADVGTSISTEAETARTGLADVVIAAGKRLGEALRVMEEAAKTIDPSLGAALQSLRYRSYHVEAELNRRMAHGRVRQWKLCMLLTESLCRLPWRDTLTAAIEGGADCVQVREKALEGAALADRVREVIELARPHGVAVIVNDRVDVALAAGADGAHLGTGDLSIRDARSLTGRALLLGASTHHLAEAHAAIEAGADYCGVGAMFSSTLKPNREPSGTRYLRQFLERFPSVPHLAIGGITPANVHQLVEAGVKGVAVSSAICDAADPRAIAASLRSAVDSACAAAAQ